MWRSKSRALRAAAALFCLLTTTLGARAAKAETPPEVPAFAVAGPSGFGMSSGSESFRLFLHWALLTDVRVFAGELPPGQLERDNLLVRFAGMQMDALLYQRFHSQIFVDFSQSKVTLYDAWMEAELYRGIKLRAGKFLYPISEERLTPGIALPFVSTSFASVLLPSRDTGVQIHGEIGGGLLKYNLALTIGAAAGFLAESDVDSDKDVVGRAYLRPFLRAGIAPLRELGIGVGASYGVHTGTVDSPLLPVLRTYGGLPFFAYRNDKTRAGTVVAGGPAARLVPHLTWSFGPVAAYADWVHERERAGRADVGCDAWSVIPSVVLTGEDAKALSYIVPKHPLDLARGHVGTMLLVGGVGGFQAGASAFQSGAADPAVAMQRANVYGGGFNWYPFSGIAVLADFGHMVFGSFGGAPARPPENTFVARFQMVL